MILRTWNEQHLIPDAWRDRFGVRGWSVLNNSIVRHRGALLMCYRVIAPSGVRWLAMCRLTEDLQVERDSIVLTSESFIGAPDWHADPRMVVLGDGLWLTYSSQKNLDHYDLYIVEIDADSLRAKHVPRPLEFQGVHQEIEKNWMPFEHDGDLWFVYRANPHVMLRADLRENRAVACIPMHHVEWDDSAYATRFGELRGGAPPMLHAGEFVSFVHSVHRVSRLRRLWILLTKRVGRLRYVGGVYAFDARPPFAPRWVRRTPVIVPPPFLRRSAVQHDVRVDRVVYPCGAVRGDDGWHISFGVDNELCCIARVDDAELRKDIVHNVRNNNRQ